jgi:hypothetical protein
MCVIALGLADALEVLGVGCEALNFDLYTAKMWVECNFGQNISRKPDDG